MRYYWDDLHRFASDCLAAAGVPREDAQWCAEVLVRADFTGVSTHGLSRLTAYIRAIQRGIVNPVPHFQWKKRGSCIVMLDGDNGLGPVIARTAMVEAITLAGQAGIGMVTVRRGNHAGAMSSYIDLAVKSGMIGWAFCNSQPAIPPWGGRKAFFGTNPVAFGAPCKEHDPVVLDFASSKVARGHIILAAKNGQPIPEGWALDEWGDPTTDPHAALRGSMLPMADAKGYAIALMVDILCGVLSGAEYGPHVGSLYSEEVREPGTGMCFIAVDPDFFEGRDTFGTRMDQIVDEIHQVPPAHGYQPVRVPGERRAQSEREGRQSGIPLSESTVRELRELGVELGVRWG